MNDFFEGMSFIQNTELKEKLDLFLKALDETGKGNLLYDEVKNICKDSIKRNLFDESQSNDEYALVELSEFFADFIFVFSDFFPTFFFFTPFTNVCSTWRVDNCLLMEAVS